MTTKTTPCLICDRIADIKNNTNPHFVVELETGYVVLGDYQFFSGYTLFLSKEHASELHELSPAIRKQFLWEMSVVAGAVFKAFQPKKLNYELLGNTDQHMHWHIFPRHADDPMPNRTVWNIDKDIRNAESAKPTSKELEILKNKLREALEPS
ncbi:MAG: HIT family protein [Candidatus Andersenbacteria bacterium]